MPPGADAVGLINGKEGDVALAVQALQQLHVQAVSQRMGKQE